MPSLLDERTFSITSGHLSFAEYLGRTPTVANGAQTTAAAVVAGSSDLRGSITCTSSGTPAAGTQATVTFGTAFPTNGVNSVPTVIVFAQNAATQAAGPYCNAANTSATSFTCDTQAAPGSAAALKFGYLVIN